MDFKQLRAFLTIAETGNVTRAAEVLHVVQPAVSRQLRLLEEDVGTALFERERHGMALTEAGKALAGYARRAMLELDRARAEIAGAENGIGGLVTIGLLPSTCELLSSPLVKAVAASYPGIRVRIAMGYAGTLQQWLESGEVDAALLYRAEPSPTIQTRPLVEEDLWLVGLPSAKLRLDRPVPLASLEGKPLILPSAPHGIRALVDHACAVAGVELNVVVETNSMTVQRSLAAGGHGLTILPPIAVADDVARKHLSAAPVSRPKITRTIMLGISSNRAQSRAVRLVVDLLVDCISSAVKRGAWSQGRWLNR